MTATASLPLTGDAAVRLARQVLESVVRVEDGNRGSGSGVVVDRRGVIITNAHVVRGETASVTTHAGARLGGGLEARDDALDLAAIRVSHDDLEPVECGDSQALRSGQLVLAVGHPLGLHNAVTVGILSRLPTKGDRRELIASNITLNRGNSGGPLLDAAGRLIGINTMVAGPGLGLSIPVHVVSRFLARHVDPRPHIDVTVQHIDAGLIVIDVQPESPAESSGILPGDVIVAVSGKPARSYAALIDGLADAGIGGALPLDLERAGVPVRVFPTVVAKA
ncbi:hypothetical protein BH23CHL2_BH23CHL2_10720 [soil metagenome]